MVPAQCYTDKVNVDSALKLIAILVAAAAAKMDKTPSARRTKLTDEA